MRKYDLQGEAQMINKVFKRDVISKYPFSEGKLNEDLELIYINKEVLRQQF